MFRFPKLAFLPAFAFLLTLQSCGFFCGCESTLDGQRSCYAMQNYFQDPNSCFGMNINRPANCRTLEDYEHDQGLGEPVLWAMPTATATATPTIIAPILPLTIVTVTRTSTPTRTATPTSTRTATPTVAIGIPVQTLAPPSITPNAVPPCISAPTPFDPPDGRTFSAKSAVFRWNSDYELQADEVFDIVVQPVDGKGSTSIGTTREKLLPIDFMTWPYAGMLTGYSWTVRIKRLDGTYLSCATQPFTFTLTDAPPPEPPKPELPKPEPSVCPPYTKCP